MLSELQWLLNRLVLPHDHESVLLLVWNRASHFLMLIVGCITKKTGTLVVSMGHGVLMLEVYLHPLIVACYAVRIPMPVLAGMMRWAHVIWGKWGDMGKAVLAV